MSNKRKSYQAIFFTLITASVLLLSACGGKDQDDIKKVVVKQQSNAASPSTNTPVKRWFTTAQKMRGKQVFKDNCAVCHGDQGQGLAVNWKQADPDGKYPAPPLNGTAHAWHHPKALLLNTVNNGGIALGGTMPAFKDKLSDKEKEAVIAYVTSLWPDKIYAMWAERNKVK